LRHAVILQVAGATLTESSRRNAVARAHHGGHAHPMLSVLRAALASLCDEQRLATQN
jgi:hypothetical protein